MISLAKFESAKNDAEKLLKTIELLGDRNKFPGYPLSMPAELRAMNYRDAWETSREKQWYDFRLINGALLQLRRDEGSLSYNYLDPPIVALEFDDFAADRMGDEWVVLESELREDL